MRKIFVFALVAIFAVLIMSCASKKKCPAYSKIEKTEMKINA